MHDVRVAAEVGTHPFGGERRHGDHRVGAPDRRARRELLADPARPTERGRLVEQREVVHGCNRRGTRTQRQIDVERVHQIGCTDTAETFDRAPDAVAVATRYARHSRGQLTDGALLQGVRPACIAR